MEEGVNHKGWSEGGVNPFTMKPYWNAVAKEKARKAATSAKQQRGTAAAAPPTLSLVNMVDPTAPILGASGVGATVGATSSNDGDRRTTATGAELVAAGQHTDLIARQQQPAKKRRAGGRLNSSDIELRNCPVTSDRAYNKVNAAAVAKEQTESDKVRKRLEREEEKRVKQTELLEKGVRFKEELSELRESLGRAPVADELCKAFTVDKLKALILAHSSQPKGNKGALASQLETLVGGKRSQPLLLKDK